jgi:FMN-dependent NADH-azoreductase/putative sterol carrier protein
MKVLALNSSPRSEGQSKTELMLSHLVKGMESAGAQVEVIHLREKKIKRCVGCFTCWTKTPGVCIHKDDMSAELFDKFRQADMVIYASPLYHYTVNATMKAFIERTLPMSEPFFVDYKGRTVHPPRYPYPRAVVLSVAGFHDEEVFDPLSAWAKYLFGKRLAAEIYRPGAEAMGASLGGSRAKRILAATDEAGRELVINGEISEATMQRIHEQSVKDVNVAYALGNMVWKTCIAEGVTLEGFVERGLVPRPDSLESFMLMMAMAFNREAAKETRATLQFDFSGEVEGSCHFKIGDGDIDPRNGRCEAPDMTIETPFETWMDVITGKADGQSLFMAEKYKVHGDMQLLMRFDQLFGR